MKIELLSLRMKDSATICGFSGQVLYVKDGFSLTLDTDLHLVAVSRKVDGKSKPSELLPVANVVSMVPASQPPAKASK